MALAASVIVAIAAWWLVGGGPLVYRGFAYVIVPAMALVCFATSPDGLATIVLVLALVWAADIGAYAGRADRRRSAAGAAISPNKTWAGLGGAVLGAAPGGPVVRH